MLKPIPDHLANNLQILFVGFNPSIRSAETGHHFANPNNRFWKILFEAGLTKERLTANRDYQLIELGYGLTNIVARPTKEAAEITKEEYEHGRLELLKKIHTYKPKTVCFVGKGVYQEFAKRRKVDWGFQQESFSGVNEFVAPSSSGLVRMKLTDIVAIYQQLHENVKEDFA